MRAIVHRTLGALAVGTGVWMFARSARYFSADPAIARYHVETAGTICALVTFGALLTAHRRENRSFETSVRGLSRTGVAPWLFVIGALVIYWPTLSVGLLSDDYGLVAHAERGDIGAITSSLVRPVPLGLWAVLHAAGAGPVVLHVVNVSLHGVVAWLTTRVAAGWGLAGPGSMIAGVLVLVSPTATEAVVWTSGVFDLTATLFRLIAALVARTYDERTSLRRRLTLALVVGAAVLSKETAAVAIVLVVLDALARRALTRTLALDASGIAMAMAAYMFMRLGSDPGVSVENLRFAVQRAVFHTFGSFAVPWHADVLAAAPGLALLMVGLVTTLAACAAASPTRPLPMRLVSAPAAWMLIAIALVVPVLVVPRDLQASRYLYLAGTGWASLLVVLAMRMPSVRLKPVTVVALAAVATLSVAGARWHQRHWLDAAGTRDAVRDAARVRPDLARCRPAVIRNLPDNVRGAYVFRNSVPEFFERELSLPVTTTGHAPGCTFVWQPETRTLVPARD